MISLALKLLCEISRDNYTNTWYVNNSSTQIIYVLSSQQYKFTHFSVLNSRSKKNKNYHLPQNNFLRTWEPNH